MARNMKRPCAKCGREVDMNFEDFDVTHKNCDDPAKQEAARKLTENSKKIGSSYGSRNVRTGPKHQG